MLCFCHTQCSQTLLSSCIEQGAVSCMRLLLPASVAVMQTILGPQLHKRDKQAAARCHLCLLCRCVLAASQIPMTCLAWPISWSTCCFTHLRNIRRRMHTASLCLSTVAAPMPSLQVSNNIRKHQSLTPGLHNLHEMALQWHLQSRVPACSA